jgi:predicted transport protein
MSDDITVKPNKCYIAFKINKTNFCDVEFQKKCLKIGINLKRGSLQDLKNIARDVSTVGHYMNGDYEIKMPNNEDIDYILSLINQSLKKNK